MNSLDWSKFESLPGSKSYNFELLCRGLIRLRYARFGQFRALANQPGVEFHLNLTETCNLGNSEKWFGWQCKMHERTQQGNLRASSKKDIEGSLNTTKDILPDITDWVLWTPYTLSKKDQEWFYNFSTDMNLHLWSEEEIEIYLSGEGLILKSTFFGELVLTPEILEKKHKESVQPIRERWLEPVHQTVEAERTIRKMLGEATSWEEMEVVGNRLSQVADSLKGTNVVSQNEFNRYLKPFINSCKAFSNTLLNFHEDLNNLDYEIIRQQIVEQNTLIDDIVRSVPRRLRSKNKSIALIATNALDDMRIAQTLINESGDFLGVGIVALLSDAGGGKTQISAELTKPHAYRPAGIFLQGRNFHKGNSLDDLANNLVINGKPIDSIEELLASLDAAGKRSKCRLPLVIDGLNEAENPKDWKAPLSILNEQVKSYPNVLVVCTLRTGEHRRNDHEYHYGNNEYKKTRETFAVQALPNDIKIIESNGFGYDVKNATQKYFEYYKIEPNDSEIPYDFFEHPLTLRIYCQVTNPERSNKVSVDHFPASLTPLFEQYISNACVRISEFTNLSYQYTSEEIESAIYKLGLQLWESKQREISETEYRTAISDQSRSWDSSIVNLLTQEGIIFRNPGVEPHEYMLTPAYDALGGFIIANSILAMHATDRLFSWFNKKEIADLFIGENSHELAYDIFNSLVALVPQRFNGTQLWKVSPETLKKAALLFTTQLESEYLDKSTIDALQEKLINHPKLNTNGSQLLNRLYRIRGVLNHPLNSNFIDSSLREMSVSNRDVSWTEWLRTKQSELIKGVHDIEEKWQNNLTRNEYDFLLAKWIMWYLTSTDRVLRDLSTRALYWFGRGNAKALFIQAVESLKINDPYVPERMLASCYGVAMALHVEDDDSFTKETLPELASKLYELIFSPEAPHQTTHILLREYASRIIELAIVYNPKLFSQVEYERSKPPFNNVIEWKESKNADKESYGAESPFRMDFENYTLGRLIPERRNYDYKNEDYKKIRSKILWRIEQLGWSTEKFKEIDNNIARRDNTPRTGQEEKKVERYGKKYSWIAYYEMAGYLQDNGDFEIDEERTDLVDIDPSFPESIPNIKIISSDFLGGNDITTKNWIEIENAPDFQPYLSLEDIHAEPGPWIILDGHFSQKDAKRGRRLFCFIRSFLINNNEKELFLEHLKNQDLSGRWLPEKPEIHYTFNGEIPWCDTFPENSFTDMSFVESQSIETVTKKQNVYYLDGNKLEFNNWLGNQISIPWFILDTLKKEYNLTEQDLEDIEIREENVQVDEIKEEYKSFKTLIPVCDFRWEDHHSITNKAGSATILAKEIANDIGLVGRPQSFDLYNSNNERVTYNVKDENDDFYNSEEFFFIKEEILRNYLKKNKLSIVHAIWGEREKHHSDIFHSHSNHSEISRKVYSEIVG